MLHQWGPYPFGIPRYGTFQRDQFLHLCSPWGAPEIDARGCRPSQQFYPRCVDPWSHRKRTGVESRHLRRDSRSGRHSCSIPRTSDGATRKEKDQGGQVVGIDSSQLSEEMEAGSGNHADIGCGPFPLSESSRRCQQRFDDETSKPSSNSEKREMGQRCLRKNLRKARKVAAAGEPIQQETGSFRRGCEEELSGLLPEKFHPAAAKPAAKDQLVFKGKRFLSLFGGVANPARFFATHGGEATVLDFAHSPKNDLSKHRVWNKILQVLAIFHIVGIDLPCNTWSRARRAPPWSRMPKPLRSSDEPFGLSTLQGKDAEKVRLANIMFYGAMRVIRRCLKQGIAGYLENPASSRLWDTPQIKKLLSDSRCQLITLDMCQYGCQWKKPTRLLFWNCDSVVFNRCSGRHFCSRTGRKHLQLTGMSGKKFLTEQAQIYSQEFAESLMLAFVSPKPTHT